MASYQNSLPEPFHVCRESLPWGYGETQGSSTESSHSASDLEQVLIPAGSFLVKVRDKLTLYLNRAPIRYLNLDRIFLLFGETLSANGPQSL